MSFLLFECQRLLLLTLNIDSSPTFHSFYIMFNILSLDFKKFLSCFLFNLGELLKVVLLSVHRLRDIPIFLVMLCLLLFHL